MPAKKKSKATPPPRRSSGPPITEVEMAFCHYLLGSDAQGKRRSAEQCAIMVGLPTEDASTLAASARVRDYCNQYTSELARQMACQEAMRRADYELSPMAIFSELFYLLKHGKDERARVAAGAKLLDWLGPLEDRMKRATPEDLLYLNEHGHWPEERLLPRPHPNPSRPGPTAAPTPEVINQTLPNREAVRTEFEF